MNPSLRILHRLANRYEASGDEVMAAKVHRMFIKLAEREEPDDDKQDEPFARTLSEVLDMFPGTLIDVECDGKMDSVVESDTLKDGLPKELLGAPAEVDAKHIVVLTPESGLQVYRIVDDDELCNFED